MLIKLLLQNNYFFRTNLLFALTLMITLPALSQSGPGGRGTTDGSSNLVLWLRADIGVEEATADPAEDTDPISLWLDQSGYGYDAVVGGGAPSYDASNADFNGMPSITFVEGTTDWLFIEDDADEAPQLDNTSELSVFYVFNPDNSTDVRAHLSKRDGNSTAQSYVFYESGSQNSRVNGNNDAGQNITGGNTYINALTYQNGDFDHFLNQTSGGGITGGTSSIPNYDSDLNIGEFQSGDGRTFDGDFAEIIIFREYLTNAERIVVETYLGSKYGITLTSDFWDEVTYSGYDNEIAGIGQESSTGSEATTASSSLLRISESADMDNDDWLFWGHDGGDISAYTSTEIVTATTQQRLAREWVINETNDLGNVTVSFAESDLPATGVPASEFYLLVDTDGDANFDDATSNLMTLSGGNYEVTLDLSDGDHLAIAYISVTPDASEVWYSYISGDWDNPSNWTLDGAVSAAYVNPDAKYPTSGDSVVINSGRTITANVDNILVNKLEVEGTLDLGSTTGHNFTYIEGSGTIRLSGLGGIDNYPTGIDTLFYNDITGGTVEYYGTGLTFDMTRRYNNLTINLDNNTDIATMTGDSIYVFGDFVLTQGFFQFNDNSATNSLAVEVHGDLNVNTNSGIDVGTANARHELNLYGDFTNQGDVDFTNRTSQTTGSEATDGIVDVNFVSADQDQNVDLQNTTDFYRIEVNKGVDDTYVVEISADDPTYFNLYGYASESTNSAQGTTNSNACGLIYGTLKVGNNVTISPLNAGGNYSIYEGSQIWMNGGIVEKTSGTAIVPYGKVRVSSGNLNAPISSGITVRDNGQLTVEGGTVTINQFRTSINGVSAQGGLIMTGGILNITGINTSTDYYTMSLTYSGNVFNMTGGTINVSGSNATGGIYINSSEENINVTGGVINLDVTNGNDLSITSNAPFFNMNILRSGASGTGAVIISNGSSGTGAGLTTLDPAGLTILNNLTIDNSGGFGTEFDANDYDLNITGTLTVENGAIVDLLGMELTLEGEGSSSLDIQTGATLSVDSLIIDKLISTDIINFLNGSSPALSINNHLQLDKGTFDLGTFDVTTNGSLILSDTVGTNTSTGLLYMNGGAAQAITSTNGFVYDLEIDNSNGVSLSGDLRVDTLTLDAGIFDINTSKLTVNSEIQTNATFSSTLMIQTDGNASDGGIVYYVDNAETDPPAILYPFGSNAKYTPAQLDLVNITDDGFIQINPVDDVLATTDITSVGLMDYYWRVRNSDYSTLPDVTSLVFTADAADLLTSTVNLAEGMTASQSSTYDQGASVAIDGNTSGNGSSFVTHTESESEASWTVDLGAISDITSINIWNRTDCCSDRLEDYYVFVSDDAFTGTSVAESQSQSGVLEFYESAVAGSPTAISTGAITGRYVRVQLAGTNFLSLAEVEVMGTYITSSFIPGGVEDGVDSNDSPTTDTSFDRFYEINGFSSPNITFDGEFSDGTLQPFQLRTANYTAGDPESFSGSPDIFYSFVPGNGFPIKWDNGDNWTLGLDATYEPHDSRQTAASDYPQAGDIAIIGWVPHGDTGGTDGAPHGIAIDGISVDVAEVKFSQMLDDLGNPTSRIYTQNFQFRPTVVVNGTGILNSGVVSGEGMFWNRYSDPDFSGADLGEFNAQDSSYFLYENEDDAVVFVNIPAELPNLLISGGGWGDNDRDFEISTDITVKQDFELLGDINLILSSGANGDIRVENDLRIYTVGSGGFGRIDFPNDANRQIEVLGDLELTNEEAIIQVANPDNTSQNVGTLIVHGNITQDVTANGGLQFYTALDEDYIELILSGQGQHAMSNISGADPTLFSLEMDKGSDTTSTFTLNSSITINGENTTAPSPLELKNGKLIFNNTGINVELTDGIDYAIPSSAGIEVTQGTITSSDANIILDGLLRINGGTVDLGTSDIEYSTTGSALIDISSGTLEVGGQVRRATSSTAGILKYRQSGGDVDIATDQAITTSRATFEVLNTGSEFTLTGGTFNIARGVIGDANESLELDPETYDLTGATITIFENLGANYGTNYFNIKSNIELNNLIISNSIDLPDVHTYVQPLLVNNLEINTNQVLEANNLDITIRGDFTNSGTYTNTSSTTVLGGTGAQALSGAGIYTIFDLTKNGTGTATLDVSLTLDNDLRVSEGTLDMGSNTISLKNDAYIESTLTNSTGDGLIFNGSTSNQDLYGLSNNTVSLSTITINNTNGVDIPDGNGYNFDLTKNLRLAGGVFNIGGSLVTMKEGSTITAVSPFSVNNMVQTNSSFTDNGFMIEFYGVTADTTIFYPVGELKYTPVSFDLSAGATAGSIRVRPANEIHPTIVNNTEPITAPNTEIDDTQNILNYYWVVVATESTGIEGSATFFYDHADISAIESDTSNFISGRILSNNSTWDKFLPTDFLGASQSFVVPLGTGITHAEITGDYTAGLGSTDGTTNDIEGSLPDELAEYETDFDGTGDYSTALNWNPLNSSPAITDGVGPVGAQIIVRSGDDLTLDISSVRLYSTEIEEGATLRIPSGITDVRLGNVSGSGTIVLTDTELLPTGEYSSFFACDGGALQYSGITSYNVLSGISEIRKVTIDGTGTRTLPAASSLNVCDTLIIDGPTVVFASSQTYTVGDSDTDRLEIQSGAVNLSNGTTLDIDGDFALSGGSFTGVSGSTVEITDDLNYSAGTLDWDNTEVTFDGTSEQLIDGDFTGSSAFKNLTIDNSGSGATINSGDIEVDGILTLTDGLFNTTTNESLTISFNGDWTDASTESYVTGPITKNSVPVASTYEFPIGKPSRYAPAAVANVGTGGQDWTAQFFTSNANGAQPINTILNIAFSQMLEVSSDISWNIEASGSNSATIVLGIQSHMNILDIDNVRVAEYDKKSAGEWVNLGGTTIGNISNGTVTSQVPGSFSSTTYTMGGTSSSSLPVTLLSFDGESKDGKVVLTWTTASEVNNDYFELERSTDGIDFEYIGYVSGNGTTNQQNNYSYVDDRPYYGVSYYRLVQVDFDGMIKTHDKVTVNNDQYLKGIDMVIFPNPTSSNEVILRLTSGDENSQISVGIYSLTGSIVYLNTFDSQLGTQEIPLAISQKLRTGIYHVKVVQGNNQIVQKLVIK